MLYGVKVSDLLYIHNQRIQLYAILSWMPYEATGSYPCAASAMDALVRGVGHVPMLLIHYGFLLVWIDPDMLLKSSFTGTATPSPN